MLRIDQPIIHKWDSITSVNMMSEKKEDLVSSLRSGCVMPDPQRLQASSKNSPVFSGSVNFSGLSLSTANYSFRPQLETPVCTAPQSLTNHWELKSHGRIQTSSQDAVL